jgi:hypothetical protein
MNIREISKPISAKALNESLAKKFGERVNLESFTTDQLYDARNKLRTRLSQVETTESFNSVQKPAYQKSKLFLDVLNAAIAERDQGTDRNRLREGAEDAAELVMAAKDMVDRITGWMEDTAEMQTESMLELADAIRDEMGSEKSEQFVQSIKPALETLYQTMETTRVTLTNGVGMLTGEGGMDDTMGMGGEDDLDMEPTVDDEMGTGDDIDAGDDLGMDDEFAADDAAMGGADPAGRAKRESVDRRVSKKK